MNCIKLSFFLFVSILVSGSARAQDMWAYFVTPGNGAAVLQFEGGVVEADADLETFTIALENGEGYSFSFTEVATFENPANPNNLVLELIAAIEDPNAARAFHSHIPNDSWGLTPG